MVVTRIAYEEGWNIVQIDENGNRKNLKPFLAQGGFVSFLADEGNNHYELDFYPPYLKESSLFTALGIFVTLITYISYLYIDLNKIDREALFLLSIDISK